MFCPFAKFTKAIQHFSLSKDTAMFDTRDCTAPARGCWCSCCSWMGVGHLQFANKPARRGAVGQHRSKAALQLPGHFLLTDFLSLNTLPDWIIENFRFPAKMKLLLQTFFCWWFIASVAPAVDSVKLDLSSVMKKRLSTWLQSRAKRDLSGVPAATDADSVQFVRPEDVKDTLKPHSSTDINIRFNNKLKVDSAPIDKISPLGYGRRRRSLSSSVAAVPGDLRPRQARNKREARELQWKALREIQRTAVGVPTAFLLRAAHSRPACCLAQYLNQPQRNLKSIRDASLSGCVAYETGKESELLLYTLMKIRHIIKKREGMCSVPLDHGGTTPVLESHTPAGFRSVFILPNWRAQFSCPLRTGGIAADTHCGSNSDGCQGMLFCVLVALTGVLTSLKFSIVTGMSGENAHLR
ncbi:hypothetical protein SKAU_G00348290 [Synaphobranchus kaupii]|uniref:Uncharacterized protein n=1 Tax=Synaphobranchus kaupii TaxID=118154 RepID=A0A9Q1EJX3_SYNKA|nr:hypothetical protein SKAU_G00348290 [Synaphobranchus kaupii]